MTWPEEIKGWTNFRRFTYSILHGRDKHLALKKKADIYIINPEGLKWLTGQLKGKHRKNWPFDMLIVDESSKFKTPGGPNTGSNRTYQMHRMVPGFKRRYIANGTPVANGFLGLMSQMYIVDQGESLGKHITYYRDRYFEQHGKPEWRMFKLQEDGEEKIMKRIAPYAICLKAEDHVDMPKRIEDVRRVRLPAKALKTYEEIEDELFTIIDGEELVAESAASLANKLHQVCNGRIYEDQDPLGKPLPSSKRRTFEIHKEKLSALDDLIDEFNGKQILIGYKFQHDKKALKDHFKSKIKFFDDADSGDKKKKLQADWNKGKIPLLAGNPASVGHGLNLQKGGASVLCMYSLDHDYETHDQFVRRLYRSGNISDTVYLIYLVADGLYDHKLIYPRLINKQNTQDTFMKALISYRNNRRLVKK